MLRAGLAALGAYPENSDNEDIDKTARLVVHAMVAISAAGKAEITRLQELHNEPHLYLHTEPAEVLATAYWVWSEKVEREIDLNEIAPGSVMGNRYLAFAQGMAAIQAMTHALDLMEDGSAFAFATRGADYLAPKFAEQYELDKPQ